MVESESNNSFIDRALLVCGLLALLTSCSGTTENTATAGLVVDVGPARTIVLASGNHAQIARWRLKQALGRTWLRRPDLLEGRELTSAEQDLLQEFVVVL